MRGVAKLRNAVKSVGLLSIGEPEVSEWRKGEDSVLIPPEYAQDTSGYFRVPAIDVEPCSKTSEVVHR